MTTAVSSSPERLHGLDALRGTALLLGVVLHAAMAYMPAPIWIATDASTSPVAAVIFFVIHLFRMGTFFLIAGLFGHMLLQRRGWVGFAKDRVSRIAGPLAIFWTPVFMGIIAVLLWKVAIDNGGTLPTDGPPPPPLTVQTFPLTHLWFLYVLMLFYAALLALRGIASLLPRERVDAALDRLAGLVIAPWSPALFAIPLGLAFWMTPDWVAFFGVPTPDYGFMPKPATLTAFGLAFFAGVLINRRRDLLKRIEQCWAPFLGTAVLAGGAALYLSGGPSIQLEPLTGDMKAVAAWTYALAVFASTFAAVALALRFFSGHSALRRYLADSSYWVYIVHLPLVIAGHVLLLGLTWPWYVKMTLVVVGVMAISLITYELLIRHSFVGKWLNGRRIPWRRPAPEPAPVAAE